MGVYAKAFFRGLKADPKLRNSQWADANFYLSPESSAVAGRWKCIPYQVEILDVFNDPDVEYISVMKSARVGYTKILNIITATCMAETPCNVMIVQPTIADAEGHSTTEIAPMLRDVPKLKGLVEDSRLKDNSNTMLRKSYRGGVLYLVGANSARGFRRISAKIALFDECDGYPATAGAEGDQIILGSRRTEYFHDRKIALGSTPTIKGVSRIEKSFEKSDKRRFYVPCPKCKTLQFLKWGNKDTPYGMKWEPGRPETTAYLCENEECAALIPHTKKRWMVERGTWIAEKPFAGHAGFHIWAAYSYSPNAEWGKLAAEFMEAKADGPEALQTFVNTVLGETWEADGGEGLEADDLATRRENYDANQQLPPGVLMITAGVDTQDDALICEILGIGAGEETWSLEYLTLPGNPGGVRVWADLEKVLRRTYQTAEGVELSIAAACIDSGGHHTQSVYDFVRGKARRRIYAIKGASSYGKPLVGRPTRSNKGKIPLVPINTIAAKDLFFARLRLEAPGAGYCHFPSNRPADYFEELTAERVITKNGKRIYIRIRKKNEGLDCRIYAMAAFRLTNARLKKVAKTMAKRADRQTAIIGAPAANEKKATTKRPTRPRPTKKGGGYVGKWKG